MPPLGRARYEKSFTLAMRCFSQDGLATQYQQSMRRYLSFLRRFFERSCVSAASSSVAHLEKYSIDFLCICTQETCAQYNI